MKINSVTMKKLNAFKVFDTIRQYEPISRKKLAEMIGLTQSSITNISAALISEGLIREAGTGVSYGGRKPVMLELVPDAAFAIGISLAGSSIDGILTDCKANILDHYTQKIKSTYNNEEILATFINAISQLIANNNVRKSSIIGIGVAVPGPYDHIKGVVLNPPNFPNCSNMPVKEHLESYFNLPVYVKKETAAAALGEYWLGSFSDTEDLFVINSMKIGLGGGAVIGGNVYYGFCDGASDIGHITIDPNGRKCKCGDTGCLEAMSTGVFIEGYISDYLRDNAGSVTDEICKKYKNINIDKIIELANAQDPLATEAVEAAAKNLSIGISSIINLYSPEIIILGGDLVLECPLYYNTAIQYATDKKYPIYRSRIKIVSTSFGKEMNVIGAVSTVLYGFFKGS